MVSSRNSERSFIFSFVRAGFVSFFLFLLFLFFLVFLSALRSVSTLPLLTSFATKCPSPSTLCGQKRSISSSVKSGCLSKKYSITSSFSSFEKVQVLYTIVPPDLSITAALSSISFCLAAQIATFSMLHCSIASGSFRNIPSPEQGASTCIALKKPGKCEASTKLSSFVTIAFLIPIRSIFCDKIRLLCVLISFDTKSPLSPKYVASCVLFPPGAAHRSSTLIPGFGAKSAAADMALGSCM